MCPILSTQACTHCQREKKRAEFGTYSNTYLGPFIFIHGFFTPDRGAKGTRHSADQIIFDFQRWLGWLLLENSAEFYFNTTQPARSQVCPDIDLSHPAYLEPRRLNRCTAMLTKYTCSAVPYGLSSNRSPA